MQIMPAEFGRLLHGAKNRGVVHHQRARIGHEQLEARNAVADQAAHLFKLRVAEVGDDAVKGVIDGRLAVGLAHPGIKRLPQAVCPWSERRNRSAWSFRRRPRQSCRSRNRRSWWCRRRACPDGCARRSPPGITRRPAASITLPAFSTGSACAIAVILPSAMPRSLANVSFAVTTVPFLITVSNCIQLSL